ncbi:hypothetical protein HDZ31DRAFT_18002, partial [Schizophyllum fasciatum]
MAPSTRRSARLSAASPATTGTPCTPLTNDGLFTPSAKDTPPTSDEGSDEDELAPLKGTTIAKMDSATPAKTPRKPAPKARGKKRAAPESSDEEDEDELPAAVNRSGRTARPTPKRRATANRAYVEIVVPNKRGAAAATERADKASVEGTPLNKRPTASTVRRTSARATATEGKADDDSSSSPSQSESEYGSSVSEFIASDDGGASSDEEDRSQYGSDTPAPPRPATKRLPPSRGDYDSDDIDDASEAEDAMVQEAVRRSRADVGGPSGGPSTSRRAGDALAARA